MEDDLLLKRCSQCEIEKDLTNYYFAKRTQKFVAACKQCRKKIPKNLSKQAIIDRRNGEKTCSICQETKTLDNFRFSRNFYRSFCRLCNLERERKKYKKPKERRLQKDIDRENGYKTCSDCQCQKPLSEFNKWYDQWQRFCRMCDKKWRRIYLAKRDRKKYNAVLRQKRKDDIQFKLTCNLRKRVWGALNGAGKSARTLELLGCSIKELRDHLEKQFYPQKLPNGLRMMTWDNYGANGWHVDHIIPCKNFDLSNPEEQKKCFHYTNLQPLWWFDNLSKGGRIKE